MNQGIHCIVETSIGPSDYPITRGEIRGLVEVLRGQRVPNDQSLFLFE